MNNSNNFGIQMRVAVIAMGTLLLATASFAGTVFPKPASVRMPEPAMLLMLGAGLSAVAALRIRLKK